MSQCSGLVLVHSNRLLCSLHSVLGFCSYIALKIFKVSASRVQTFVRVGGLEWHMVFYYARNKSHIDTIPAVGPQISVVWLSKCIT